MALSCLFVALTDKHSQNSFHHAIPVDNQGFDTESSEKKKSEVLSGAD